MPVQRLLKFNEANVAMQKALMSQASAAASSSTGASKGKSTSGAAGTAGTGTGRARKDGRGMKRGREEVSSRFLTRIPGTLVSMLVPLCVVDN